MLCLLFPCFPRACWSSWWGLPIGPNRLWRVRRMRVRWVEWPTPWFSDRLLRGCRRGGRFLPLFWMGWFWESVSFILNNIKCMKLKECVGDENHTNKFWFWILIKYEKYLQVSCLLHSTDLAHSMQWSSSYLWEVWLMRFWSCLCL